MSTPTYTLIDSRTLDSSTGSISFTSITQSYTDLVVVASARTDSTVTTNSGASNFDTCYLRLNNNLSNVSTTHYMEGVGSGSPSASTTVAETIFRAIGATNANATANVYGSSYFVIGNYNSTAYGKGTMWQMTGENNATLSGIRHSGGTFNSTVGVSQIDIFPISGSFVAGSTFYLYGIKSENQENVPPTLKATGGYVTWDSQYVYHTFSSSGNFVTIGSVTCDVVRVAGGGGGGATIYSQAGGGGAGGLLYSAGQGLNGSYSISIGAGGAGGIASSVAGIGSQGSSTSAFGLTAPTGGGGGGTNFGGGPTNGGSGGGGGNDFLGPGTGIAGQGFNGAVLAGSYLGGGGGGAGAAAPTNQYGVGGVGLVYFNRYLAGGGSGSTGMNNTSIWGGGGSIAHDGTSAGISGVYATGGGGGTGTGGPSSRINGGNGGSGVVIVRYAR